MSAAAEETVESPCVSICVMDAGGGYCTGCLRTLAEIANWTIYPAAEKRAVLERTGARRATRNRS